MVGLDRGISSDREPSVFSIDPPVARSSLGRVPKTRSFRGGALQFSRATVSSKFLVTIRDRRSRSLSRLRWL